MELDYPLLIEEASKRRYEAISLQKWDEADTCNFILQELIEESIWLRLNNKNKA